ncbi:MAG: hypothetical protein CFE35_18440 [Novosphingobium sp. PASSN1]|nr:MAG: hypothetical protein CFE35_18440 [Novosphingobium sp. PASSN1]
MNSLNCVRRWPRAIFAPLSVALVALTPLAVTGTAQAQEMTSTAETLQTRWSTLLDAAIERRAADAGAVAQRGTADARRALAAQRFAGPLEADVSVRQDQIGSGTGYQEVEGGISAPLWRRGERAALRGEADALAARAEAELALVRLELAGELRTAWWALASAVADVRVAREQVEFAQALVANTKRLEAAGEQARLDLLQAEAALALSEHELAQAIGREGQARAEVVGLVGFAPAQLAAETVRAAQIDDHPLVRVALAEADQLARQSRLARLKAQPAWRVGLDLRSERDGRDIDARTSTGVRLSRALGRDPSAGTEAASLEAQGIAVLKKAAAIRLSLETAQAQSVASLAAARAGLKAQEVRLAISIEALTLTERGWREGELPFLELLRARAATSEAARAAVQARVAVDAAISSFNQAQGLLLQDQTS